MRKKIPKRIPDTIVVGDTSALISLGVGLVLNDCLTISKIVVPKKVKQELDEMSHFNDEDGIAVKGILAEQLVIPRRIWIMYRRDPI